MIEISKKSMLAHVKQLQVSYAEHLEKKLQKKLTNEQQIKKGFQQTDINHLE